MKKTTQYEHCLENLPEEKIFTFDGQKMCEDCLELYTVILYPFWLFSQMVFEYQCILKCFSNDTCNSSKLCLKHPLQIEIFQTYEKPLKSSILFARA